MSSATDVTKILNYHKDCSEQAKKVFYANMCRFFENIVTPHSDIKMQYAELVSYYENLLDCYNDLRNDIANAIFVSEVKEYDKS